MNMGNILSYDRDRLFPVTKVMDVLTAYHSFDKLHSWMGAWMEEGREPSFYSTFTSVYLLESHF